MVKEEVIKLKIEGKSYSEISRILGVNESTANESQFWYLL